MAGRLVLVSVFLVAFLVRVAGGEAKYQSTRDGKTLVWNSDTKPGDAATWSGDRDRNDYAKGFGRLTWYTLESGADEPQLYARYWGRMVNGKLEGPVNVHTKKKTDYAIFIDGNRMTRWTPGTAPLSATARWQTLVAKRSRIPAADMAQAIDRRSPRDEVRGDEPEAPAAGPEDQRTDGSGRKSAVQESIRDVYTDRRPMSDIDDSLRLLAFPPRTLRK